MIIVKIGKKPVYSNKYPHLAIQDYITNQLLENKDNFIKAEIEEQSDTLNQISGSITREALEKFQINKNNIDQTNLNIANSIAQTEIRLVGENNIGVLKTLDNKRAYIFPEFKPNPNRYIPRGGGKGDNFYNQRFKPNVLANMTSSNSKQYSHQSPLKYEEFRPKSRSRSRSRSKPRIKDKGGMHSLKSKQNASHSKSPSSHKLRHKRHNKSRSHSRHSHKEKINSRSNSSSGNTKGTGHYIKSQKYNKSDEKVSFPLKYHHKKHIEIKDYNSI